jgi:hypothetical protein
MRPIANPMFFSCSISISLLTSLNISWISFSFLHPNFSTNPSSIVSPSSESYEKSSDVSCRFSSNSIAEPGFSMCGFSPAFPATSRNSFGALLHAALY